MHRFLACVVVLAVMATGGQAAKQWYGVQGTLKCGNEPVKGAKVWLYDIDVGFDDSMAKNCSDDQGNFQLGGYADDPLGMTIDPTLKIYHSCNAGSTALTGIQLRNWSDKWLLPKNIGTYFNPNTFYDFGTYNLQSSTECRTKDAIQMGFPC